VTRSEYLNIPDLNPVEYKVSGPLFST